MNCYATNAAASTILYIDDDSDDCMMLQISLQDSGSAAKLVFASNGEEAVEYLNSVYPTSLPNLIVMDMNMPRWDGKRTLSYLKSQPHLASIPVVMFSTSGSKSDRDDCAQLGAMSYFTKPYHFDGYKSIVEHFGRYMKASA